MTPGITITHEMIEKMPEPRKTWWKAEMERLDATPSTPSGEGSDAATCSVSSEFDQWWANEGSTKTCSITADPRADITQIRKLCLVAWSNGADKMRMSFSPNVKLTRRP